MEKQLIERLEKLERKHLRLKYGFGVTILFLTLFFIMAFSNRNSDDKEILKAKGLIIVDEQGKPRIILGAPINKLEDRKRTDNLFGISYLDSNGIDRLTFGQEPAPMTSEGLKERRTQGVGILIHDKEGIERGGYGVLDDDMALLTLDWPKTGEAIALSSGNDFSGIGVFHKSKIGEYREALTIGNIASKKQTFIKVVDTTYTDRFRLEANGTENVNIRTFEKDGKEIEK